MHSIHYNIYQVKQIFALGFYKIVNLHKHPQSIDDDYI